MLGNSNSSRDERNFKINGVLFISLRMGVQMQGAFYGLKHVRRQQPFRLVLQHGLVSAQRLECVSSAASGEACMNHCATQVSSRHVLVNKDKLTHDQINLGEHSTGQQVRPVVQVDISQKPIVLPFGPEFVERRTDLTLLKEVQRVVECDAVGLEMPHQSSTLLVQMSHYINSPHMRVVRLYESL